MKNKGSDRFIHFLVYKGNVVEKIFLVITILSVLCIPFIGINYDLTEYLPDTTKSKQGIDLMQQQFGYPGTGRIMIDDVTIYEAANYKRQIEAVDGVDQVLWCDTSDDIYQSEQFVAQSDISDYYKDNCAVMDITFVNSDSSRFTSQALDDIQDILGEKGHIIGSAIQNKSLQESLKKEITLAMVLAVVCIFVILTLTTTSWVEPIVFLLVMGIAILINKGTNIFLGTISFLTDSVSAVLQLAVAMDYSIFLLHSFTHEQEKGLDRQEALGNAIRKSVSSILASGATTFVGFIVLTLMKFSIGWDLGIVLAKSIVVSLLTVLMLMPSLILRFANLIERTHHRSFLPAFHKFSRGVYHVRWAVLALAIIIIVPAYIGQNMNRFEFGNGAVSAGKGTKVYEDQRIIQEKFGQSNLLLAIIPNTSSVSEKELSDDIKALPYCKSVTSLAETLPDGIPADFLPSSLTGQLHNEEYCRILIYVSTKSESEAAYQASDEIQDLIHKYYPKNAYLVGETPSTQDIETTITADYSFVNILSLIGVFLVVLFTFQSLLVPFIVLVPIELAIFINMAFPYIAGDSMIYIGYIIVSCIQLGATVDYSILTTNNYLDCRESMDKKEAAIHALELSTPSIITSGTILTVVGYNLYFTSTIGAIGSMGHLIGRGGLVAMLCVLLLLPALLLLLDKPIIRQRSRAAARRARRLGRLHELQAIPGKLAYLPGDLRHRFEERLEERLDIIKPNNQKEESADSDEQKQTTDAISAVPDESTIKPMTKTKDVVAAETESAAADSALSEANVSPEQSAAPPIELIMLTPLTDKDGAAKSSGKRTDASSDSKESSDAASSSTQKDQGETPESPSGSASNTPAHTYTPSVKGEDTDEK